MMDHLTQTPSFAARLAQRQTPRPRPHVMYQNWRDLLFLHWRWDPDEIAQKLPPGLQVDTFDGAAWLGIVPLFMRNVRPRWTPAVPGFSSFMELNLRTYVYDQNGQPGVWFFSLDAGNSVAVMAARTFLHLPYYSSSMRSGRDPDGAIAYESRRRGSDVICSYGYRPNQAVPRAEPGTLEFFLVERYLLFSYDGRRLYTGRVSHSPYPLNQVEVLEWDTNLLQLEGFTDPGRDFDHAIYSPGVNVRIHPSVRG